MKILITGGLGNLGSWLTEYFCNKGYEVFVLSYSNNIELENLNYKLIKADITDLDELNKNLPEKIDYCLHTASANDFFILDYYKKALAVNAMGTRNLAQALLDKNLKKLVYFSTFHVYGALSGTIDETTIPNLRNDYATTHLFGEYYLKQFYNTHKFPYTTIRLTNSYGAPKTKHFTKWYLVLNDLSKMAFEKKIIKLNSNGKVKRDFIWMGDVCEVSEKLLFAENTINEAFNLSGEKSYQIIDIANMVQKVYKNRYGEYLNIEINSADTNDYNDELIVNCNKLKTIIDYTAHEKFYQEINAIFDILENQ
jgi:UDP-glucose 4-epimerase